MAVRGFFSRAGKAARRAKAWMMDYAYLVTLGAVIAVIAASAIYTERLHERERSVEAAAGAPETRAATGAEAEPSARVTPLPTIAPIGPVSAMAAGSAVWPLDGEILRVYDEQTQVYWPALGCYQPHNGLDIAGEAGAEVVCMMDGVVRQAVRDELWGWRVAVEQKDGSETVYAGLLACGVQPGRSVARGQALGTLLARIPCEAELGTHLHVERWRGGVSQDPDAILPEKR